MQDKPRSPSELRSMFGANLRHLCSLYPSVSEVARQLGINRTQFNRYLSGESFPRPDVLDRICRFFDVDARILLEPVTEISHNGNLINGPFLTDFLGTGARNLRREDFPDGFYRFIRRAFFDESRLALGLVYVFRQGENTYIRGYEPREAIRQQSLPMGARFREFRGFVMQQDDGIAMLVSRGQSMTCSFNYLSRIPSYENNYWVGYATRTTRESATALRAARMIYEHLGRNRAEIMKTARNAGFAEESILNPFQRRLLQLDMPFR